MRMLSNKKVYMLWRNWRYGFKKMLRYKYFKKVTVFFYSNQFRLPNKPWVVFNNMEVACKPEVRVLGIYITENLKWNSMTVHYVQVWVTYIIESLEAVLNPCVLKSIYFVYFQSCLKYGIIFWEADSESKMAFIVQKWVIRIISGANKCKSCRQIFKEYISLTLTSIYILGVMCFIKRYEGSMNQNLLIHGHNTRSKLNFHVEFCITVLFQKSVVNVGIKLYNTVPEHIRNWVTLNSLKRNKNPYYWAIPFIQ
jgi:hypothetical protein